MTMPLLVRKHLIPILPLEYCLATICVELVSKSPLGLHLSVGATVSILEI